MSAITITFGDAAENHVGMQKLGQLAQTGLTQDDLLRAKQLFEAAGCVCELLDLVALGDVGAVEPKPEPAWVLVVRDGVNAIANTAEMLAEHRRLPVDKQFFNRRTGTVCNKIARWNLCFADDSQEPDYGSGKGRVVAFNDIPHTALVKAALPHFFGEKADNLYAEGNYYYRPTVCGIGPHGDAERRIVIAVRLGESIPLQFHWYIRHRPVGKLISIPKLNSGDIYAMSSKAVGTDWRRSIIPTLRHAAGAVKYLEFK